MKFNNLYNRYRPAFALSVLIIILAIVLLLPFQFKYRVTVSGKLLSSREWIVGISGTGQVTTTLINRHQGVTNTYSIQQFDRQDMVKFTMKEGLRQGSQIKIGDTIGFIHSNLIDYTIERLHGELANSNALLAQARSGEKTSVVAVQQKAIDFAIAQFNQLEKEFNRQKQLFEKKIVSLQEYEIAERKAIAAKIAIDIERAKLISITTGAKPEDIEVIKNKIQAQINEMDILHLRKKDCLLVSPISGVLIQYRSRDTLFSIAENSSYVVLMPVQINEKSYVNPGQSVAISSFTNKVMQEARVTGIDYNISNIRGMQVFLTTASFNSQNENFHGFLAECSIDCGVVNTLEYIKRKMNTLLR